MSHAVSNRQKAKWLMQKNNPNPVCRYCDKKLRWPKSGETGGDLPDIATVDHVLPKSAGGCWHTNNLVVSCWACNQSFGNSLLKPTVSPVEPLDEQSIRGGQ